MFVDEYTRYSLLQQNGRVVWRVDKKALWVMTCLTLPLVLFCGTYMMIFGIYEKIVYPRSSMISELPTISLYRATRYADQQMYNNSIELYSVMHNSPPVLNNFKVVCYYNFPSRETSLQTKDIDPFLCTHINIGFGSVVNSSIYLNEQQLKSLQDIVNLKSLNTNLKILLSIGGAGNDSGFPEMVLNHTQRKTFIGSVFSYVKKYKIDGIDLDWEFPGDEPNFDKYQRMHFTQLLLELRTAINRQPKYSFLVSVAVAAPSGIVDTSYDVSYMNDYVDYVNLMTYDFHYFTKMTPFTGINSPLYPSTNEKFYLATLNINYSSHYWNHMGMDKSKIMIGLPTYGHTFRLTNSRNKGLYAPALGYGKLGISGFASFPEVCNFLIKNHISPVFDMESYSPYASKYLEWISFDDEESLTYKAEFIRNNNFGGAMIYCLNTDDYLGVCKMGGKSGQKFPLSRKVKDILDNREIV